MLHLRHVYKTYPGPSHALRGINLEIDKGSFVFLTGPSGAGKTTLFRLLTGYEMATSGDVWVGDYSLSRLNFRQIAKLRREIGVIYQDYKLLKDRSVFDNVALPLRVRGENQRYIERRVSEVLELVGLNHRKNYLPLVLSGGEQQRVAVARAIVHYPNLIIADEPTGNLDPDLSREIMELLEKVNAQGTTVFVATHDLAAVDARAHRHIKLKMGELVTEATI